ncbi:MAG: DNA repair protein RecN [Clostridiales bacterium]|jgi:DNA repair protein RecN (Recombination protein N)|nr:DNA repair protein RecN [Clostridiales bacterium]
MLELLKVKNVALIEEVELEFCGGLNILTGETGAGKSILIDSLSFVLGGRVGREFVRAGAEFAEVEAFFRNDDEEILIYRRHDNQGRSVCKVNGKTITISMLREISAQLLDVHGQHEHQSLLDSNRHLELLDRFCQEELHEPKARLLGNIVDYKKLQQYISELEKVDGNEEQLEFYRFQFKEIEEAKLSTDEEAELSHRKLLLVNSERISRAAHGLVELNIAGILANAAEFAATIAELDPSQNQDAENLADLHAQIEDLSLNFARYAENLEHDPAEIDEIEARLDILYRLKQKYKKNIPEILEYYIELQKKFEVIESNREEKVRLAAEKRELEKEIGRNCLIMSKIRKEAAERLSAQIAEILRDLGMSDARFAIEVSRRKEFGTNGFDRAQFLICANKGEEIAPLDRIASGGEMSRIMLALKTALANYDNIPTFIFDEIDAGISGRTAQQVAQKLAVLSISHQILCITHLPQIAAMGDANFMIEKSAQGERSLTHVHRLTEDGVTTEIARLIGGAQITNTTRLAAQEMRRQAQNIKEISRISGR